MHFPSCCQNVCYDFEEAANASCREFQMAIYFEQDASSHLEFPAITEKA